MPISSMPSRKAPRHAFATPGSLSQGIEEGAKLITGGLGRPHGISKGYFVKPTVFADVQNSMTMAREEIFGPVLSISPYEGENDAIRIANDTPMDCPGS